MIKVALTNEILKYIAEIDKNRYKVSSVRISRTVTNKLRKNSKKKSIMRPFRWGCLPYIIRAGIIRHTPKYGSAIF